jgi:hypothetical protein
MQIIDGALLSTTVIVVSQIVALPHWSSILWVTTVLPKGYLPLAMPEASKAKAELWEINILGLQSSMNKESKINSADSQSF